MVYKSKDGQHGYTAKVIEGYNFVQEFPADKIDLAFNVVIHANIFYVSAVSPEIMRLWALHRASGPQLRQSNVALPDPFYMHCHNMESTTSQDLISNYLFRCMIMNLPHKDTFLVPYCNNDRHWIVIALLPMQGLAYFFDLKRDPQKQWTRLKEVLNDALRKCKNYKK